MYIFLHFYIYIYIYKYLYIHKQYIYVCMGKYRDVYTYIYMYVDIMYIYITYIYTYSYRFGRPSGQGTNVPQVLLRSYHGHTLGARQAWLASCAVARVLMDCVFLKLAVWHSATFLGPPSLWWKTWTKWPAGLIFQCNGCVHMSPTPKNHWWITKSLLCAPIACCSKIISSPKL